MKKHAEFAPSSLSMFEKCARYTPEAGDDKIWAKEGTAMHHAMETGDLAGLDGEQRVCVERCWEVFEEETKDATEIHKELTLEIAGNTTFGTADLIALWPKKAFIGDAKFGRIAVTDAKINLQGWAYAIGLFERYPQIDDITVMFVQPRLTMVTSHSFNRQKDFERIKGRVDSIIEKATLARKSKKKDYYSPNEISCLYCGNRASCPAVAKLAVPVARANDTTLAKNLPKLIDPKKLTTPVLRSNAEVTRRILEKWCDAVKQWCDSVKEHNVSAVVNGEDVPGYSIRYRKNPRKILSIDAAFEAVKDRMSRPEFEALCSVSISALVESISSKLDGTVSAGKLRDQLVGQLEEANAISEEISTPYLGPNK